MTNHNLCFGSVSLTLKTVYSSWYSFPSTGCCWNDSLQGDSGLKKECLASGTDLIIKTLQMSRTPDPRQYKGSFLNLELV